MPVAHDLLDPESSELERLHETADAHGAAFLLLDRHGRVRGTWRRHTERQRPPGHRDRATASWQAQDPPSR